MLLYLLYSFNFLIYFIFSLIYKWEFLKFFFGNFHMYTMNSDLTTALSTSFLLLS